MDHWTSVGGKPFLACVVLAFGLVGPARFANAQSIDQLTDVTVEIASPVAISDDGSQVFTAASIDPDGGNPLNKFQLYSIDPVTATATRLSDFARGVRPLSLDLEVANLLGVTDDGSKLAFVGVSDPLGTNSNFSPELFVMNADGTGLAQLTDDPLPNAGSISRIAFAGAGSRVVFVSNSDLAGTNPTLRANVFVIDTNGANLARLTDLPPGNFSGLTISDDGTRIAFSFDGSADFDEDGTADNTDFSFELFTVASDGTGLTKMTDSVDFDSVAPFISGDGAKIVFQSNGNLVGQNNKNQDEVFIVDWDGSNMDQLTDSRSNISGQVVGGYSPSISDTAYDGTSHWVYYSSNDTQSGVNLDGNFEIYRKRSTARDETFLTDTSFSDGNFIPVVSGDDVRVVFYSVEDPDGTADGRDNNDGSPELYSVDPDGSAALQLTSGEVGLIKDASITPDGTTIVFASTANFTGFDPDRNGEIYTMDSDGSGVFQVSDMFSGEAKSPTICADGSVIAFLSDDDLDGTNSDGSFELHLVNGDGTGLRRVTSGVKGKEVRNPQITQDCSLVLYDSDSNELGNNADDSREIWSVTTDGSATLTQLTFSNVKETYSERPRLDDSGNLTVFQTTADLDDDGTSSGNWEVWRSALDGSSLELVAAEAGFDFIEPDISGDGSLVAYSSNADPLGTNPENNFELFLYDRSTMVTTQLTSTTSGSSGKPDFSNDGRWVFFITNSDLFEADPDEPFHGVRINVATLEFERIGALENGSTQRPVPNDSGNVSVFTASGNPTLRNFDFSPELFIVRHDDGPITGIGVSGPAPTALSVPRWLSGPMRYDFVRGDISQLASGGPGQTDLGALTCVENDSMDLDTLGSEDSVDPVPGQGFFYLWRGDSGNNVGQGSYGKSSDGSARTPGAGDCGA